MPSAPDPCALGAGEPQEGRVRTRRPVRMRVYRSLGWVPAGAIPGYARSADGSLDASAFYYRLLD